MEIPWQSSVWCQDGSRKACAAARSLDTDTYTRRGERGKEGRGGEVGKREREKRGKETKRTDQVNVALPALSPAPFFLRRAPDQMSNKNSVKKSRDGTTSISPTAEALPTPQAFPSTSRPALRDHPNPGPLCPPPQRGLNRARDIPEPRGGRAQAAGPTGLGPAQRERPVCRSSGSQSSPPRRRRAGAGGYSYLSGLFPGPAAA